MIMANTMTAKQKKKAGRAHIWAVGLVWNLYVRHAGQSMITIWQIDFINLDYVFAYTNIFYCNESNDKKLSIINP